MALSGAYSVPNSAAVQLNTLVPENVKRLDIRANPGNSAVVYIGTSEVTIAGVNAYIALSAGDSYGLEAKEGDVLSVDPDGLLYLIATTTDKVHISFHR